MSGDTVAESAWNTHGNEMMLYSIPMRKPKRSKSEICATHGVMRAMNAPEKNPYVAEKSIKAVRPRAISQMVTQARPDRNAAGVSRLKRPMVSDR